MPRLVLQNDLGGLRHYLVGKPVHCGTSLELQAVEFRIAHDGNEETVRVDRWVPVRYEALLFRGEDCKVTLYTEVGGHTAKIDFYESMEFRWPRR